MSFYGKDPEPKPGASQKRFTYTLHGSDHGYSVKAQSVYFYESGHVGFWNEPEDGERVLVLAVKANDVWEEDE